MVPPELRVEVPPAGRAEVGAGVGLPVVRAGGVLDQPLGPADQGAQAAGHALGELPGLHLGRVRVHLAAVALGALESLGERERERTKRTITRRADSKSRKDGLGKSQSDFKLRKKKKSSETKINKIYQGRPECLWINKKKVAKKLRNFEKTKNKIEFQVPMWESACWQKKSFII